VQLEICPFIDESLTRLLGRRGYRVHEWQQAWVREVGALATEDVEAPAEIRPVRPGDEEPVVCER
jgi:hypothetical protein